jgi:hypothetical protein
VSYKYLISFDFDEDVTHSECGTDCAEDNEVMYLNTLWIVEFNSSPDDRQLLKPQQSKSNMF